MSYGKIRSWMYRNARPIDLSRFIYHFENGLKEDVIDTLSFYQNNDGGFGHALEIDSWNPNSSPIQTWSATEIIREIGGLDKQHPMIKSILIYLEKCSYFKDGYWLASIPTNDLYPHAPWWKYSENIIEEWRYNPTASLAGFIIYYADKESSLYLKALDLADNAVSDLFKREAKLNMDELNCYSQLYEYLNKTEYDGKINLQDFRKKLVADVSELINKDKDDWEGKYVSRPSWFIDSKESIFYQPLIHLIPKEIEFLKSHLNSEGIWDITWKWSEYDKEFAISECWWKANLVIINLKYMNIND